MVVVIGGECPADAVGLLMAAEPKNAAMVVFGVVCVPGIKASEVAELSPPRLPWFVETVMPGGDGCLDA